MYATSNAPEQDWRNFRVTANPDRNGIEIRFPVTPPEDVRQRLGKKAGKGFLFTASHNDPRWYAPASPDLWAWVESFVQEFIRHGALLDTSGESRSQQASGSKRSRFRRQAKASDAATPPPPAPSNVTPIKREPPAAVVTTVPIAMNIDSLLSVFESDADDMLAWAEQFIQQEEQRLSWKTNLKQLAGARHPDPLSVRYEFAKFAASFNVMQAQFQIAMARAVIEQAQTAAPPPTAKPLPPIAVEPASVVVEVTSPKKALRGDPRIVFSQPSVPLSPLPPTPVRPAPATETKANATPRVGQPTQTAPRLNEKPKIAGNLIILDDDDLRGTERYVGCYAVLNGQLGLSFKGLRSTIRFRAQGLTSPYEAHPGTFQPLKASRALVTRITAMLFLWSNWQRLIEIEQDAATSDDTHSDARKAFNDVYDRFVSRHGTLATNAHLCYFEGMQDPRLTPLRSLEQDGKKAPIFFTRTHFPRRDLSGKRYDEINDENLAAAMTLSLSEYGEVKADAIAVWFAATPEQIEAALVECGLCCLEPVFPEAHGHRSFCAEIDAEPDDPKGESSRR